MGYQGKSKAQTMLYVCFAASMSASVRECTVCVCVCLCAVTSTHPSSHQFLPTIRRSKQPSIHGAMHLSIYPCSCPSVRLMSLASITMYHATHVFSLALYVGVKSLTCASIDAALQRPPCPQLVILTLHVARVAEVEVEAETDVDCGYVGNLI